MRELAKTPWLPFLTCTPFLVMSSVYSVFERLWCCCSCADCLRSLNTCLCATVRFLRGIRSPRFDGTNLLMLSFRALR